MQSMQFLFCKEEMVRSNGKIRGTVLSFVADFWEVLKIPLSIFTISHFTTEQELQVN